MEDISILFEKISTQTYQLIPIDNCLSIKCENITDQNFGKLIAHKLFDVLKQCTTAKVLSANQIGLNYNVMVLNVREPLYFINPKILDAKGMIEYLEPDNSFPEKLASTFRYGRILVSALNFKSPIWFGVKQNQLHLLQNQYATTHPVVEECVTIQHGIDMLNGITMFDRKEPYELINKEPGRNEIVTLVKDGQEIKLKYKKITDYINNGWTLK